MSELEASDRCPECGSWDAQCASGVPVDGCECARCSSAALARAEREREEARRFGEDAARLYNDIVKDHDGRLLTCAFCGEEYPPGTPPTQHDALRAHIAVCQKHPIREAERDRDDLRRRLAEAVEALEKYGLHYPDCLLFTGNDRECDCGYDKALRRAREVVEGA